MDAPCLACARGPSGSAGHADLVVRAVGDARISLQCGRCDSSWSRTIEREGRFAWCALTERMAASPQSGVAVPPRSTSIFRALPTGMHRTWRDHAA